MKFHQLYPVAFLILLAGVASSVHGQEEYFQDQAEQAESVRSGRGAGDFVVAPIPIVDPTLGNGLGLIAMKLYKLDEGSQASLTGVGGLYTDTESWGAGIANV